MLEFQGKTFDWSGWRFTVEGNKIIARPILDPRPRGVDLEFEFPDSRDDLVISRVRQIMSAVNVGAYIRAARTRMALGLLDFQKPYNHCDPVWQEFPQPEWVIYGSHGTAHKPFEEFV